MKTIWIINQYSGSRVHGMEFRHYYLAKEFVKQGHRVYIISGSYSHLYRQQPGIKGDFTFEDIDGITYCWVKVPVYERSISIKRILNMLSFMRMLRKLPLQQLSRPDAIVVSSPSLFPVKRAAKWAKKFGARFIFEVRDIWPLTLQELGNLSPRHPLIAFMQGFEKFAYRHADKVVSVLPGAKAHMISKGMKEDKFVNIPNGIDLDEMTAIAPLNNDTAQLFPRDKFIVGYAGTIGLANALEYFIDAAWQLKDNRDIHFVLVGDGGEKAALQERAKGLGNITFIPSVKKSQVQSALQKMDALYIGWRREKLYRFGISANKLFDYMYSGKPVIHSVEAANDPVKEAGCGISVMPEDPAKICEAVLRLYNMSECERSEAGKSGNAYVLAHHTYKALAEKYSGLL